MKKELAQGPQGEQKHCCYEKAIREVGIADSWEEKDGDEPESKGVSCLLFLWNGEGEKDGLYLRQKVTLWTKKGTQHLHLSTPN